MKYLSFNELSLKLGGRSRSTIYRDVELGRLPKPIKIGGRIYWLEQKIDEVLDISQNKNLKLWLRITKSTNGEIGNM